MSTHALPIERFLGPHAASGGPFALLGLAPEDCSEELVLLQLDRQLARVAAHPDAGTPDAEEIRMALHAAAARLLERSGPVARASHVPTPGHSAGQVAMQHAILTTLAQFGGWNSESMHRLMLIAQMQSLSPSDLVSSIQLVTRRRPHAPTPSTPPAAASAPDHAAPPAPRQDGREEARQDSPSPAPVLMPPPLPEPMPAPTREPMASTHELREIAPDPGAVAVRRLVMGVAIALGVLIALLAVALTLVGPKKPAPPPGAAQTHAPDAQDTKPSMRSAAPLFPTTRGGTTPTTGPESEGPLPDEPPPLPEVPRDFAPTLAKLRDPALTANTEQLHAALDELSLAWIRASPDQLAAAQNSVVEILYRLGSAPDGAAAVAHALRALDGVLARPVPAGSVPPAAWSAGLAARLTRERDLPASITREVQRVMLSTHLRGLSASGADFAGGGAALLASLIELLLPEFEIAKAEDPALVRSRWQAWSECVGALPLATTEKDRLITTALDALLKRGPEPTRDRGAYDAIAILAARVSWEEAGDSRVALIDWFDAEDVTSADLNPVTNAVVTLAKASGTDISFVLPSSAGELQRTEIRDRFRLAWSIEDPVDRRAQSKDWADAARLELTRTPDGPPEARFARAVLLSRLNEAAGAIWAGDIPRLTDVNRDIDRLASSVSTPGSGFIPTPEPSEVGPAEDSWLVKYLAAQYNVPARRQLLAQYTLGDPRLRTAEAGVIVNEAFRGAPAEVRILAGEVARRNVADPAFVSAMLEALPTVPLTTTNVELISDAVSTRLPSTKDPAWRLSARRALVERLLQLVAGAGRARALDEIADLLAESYHNRARHAGAIPRPAAAPPPADPTAPEPVAPQPPPVEASAQLLRQHWQTEAARRTPTGRETTTLAQLDSTRSARRRLASGRVQQFAAEQVSLAELMGYVVASERPARREKVAAILDSLAAARRSARHISAQLEAAEHAMLGLWLIRLGVDEP